ncbi:MAG TPA: hypothetical protein VKQ32_25530 [Polyangia bacterium]|nr:hypothetical protein [Polyangia bacterium]
MIAVEAAQRRRDDAPFLAGMRHASRVALRGPVLVFDTEENPMKTIRLLLLLCIPIAGAAIPGVARADTTFVLTNSGISAWLVAGVSGNNPTLTLIRGQTYHFQVPVTGHPLFISTTFQSPTGPHFTDGVTNENVQNGTMDFVVPASATGPLFYQCGNHPLMSGQLTIVTPSVGALPPIGLAALALLLAVVAVVALRRRARS